MTINLCIYLESLSKDEKKYTSQKLNSILPDEESQYV